ncbi:retron St85 family RNA-directed DNA polymerase [Vibrio tetraodonis]|uniref:retron St85 family RNA-directed DNA polymerase n=1 Tax=Vibrio TaxID=662 RepID=UPI000E0A8FA8|nr:retron St85 family RNA-directed DNA polymerase [Vibrio tetraodonis]MDG2621619.1 retron St85 family RNA-directed DNA polymerase [Vibrio parahaemolyticus]HBK3326028.1 retron St85 family RNA-directed DNA polymerase [Vibrio parahaemolyticus]
MNILDKISELSGIPQDMCARFVVSAPVRYKRYEIPKRNGGGTRLIAQPSKSVKPLQRVCISELRGVLPIHGSALAYEAGTGIKRNANKHRYNRYLLKMDFTNFFPSIKPDVLLSTFEQHNVALTEVDKFVLSSLLFWKPSRSESTLELSIGAPSSPFISNAVMYFFDVAVTEYCERKGITYTRYADDLAFSTNTADILFELPKFLNELVQQPSMSFLRFNTDKTVFASKKVNRHITGVTITNDGRLSLGRKRKRKISSLIHRFSLQQLRCDEEVNELKGMLGFAKHIEPIFVRRMCQKYGEEIILKIQKFNSD